MKRQPRQFGHLWHGHPAHVSAGSRSTVENRKSKIENQRAGFSLTEVLLAAGILMIGFLLISSTLPVGIHLTARGTERAIAAVVADEAFAKIRLFGVQRVRDWPAKITMPPSMNLLADPNVMHAEYGLLSAGGMTDAEFAYPSTDVRPDTKKYYWSAILRYNGRDQGDDTVQATVFVSRTTGAGVQYPLFDRRGQMTTAANVPTYSPFPRPALVPVEPYSAVTGKTDRIWIPGNPTDPAQRLVTDESVLVDDRTGQIMRVIERQYPNGPRNPAVIVLDGNVFDVDAVVDVDRDGSPDQRYAWVLPPAVGGGRYPGVGVYQRVIKFSKAQ